MGRDAVFAVIFALIACFVLAFAFGATAGQIGAGLGDGPAMVLFELALGCALLARAFARRAE